MSDADRTNEIPTAAPTSRSLASLDALVDEKRAVTAQMSRPPIPSGHATLMGTGAPPPPPPLNKPVPSKPPPPPSIKTKLSVTAPLQEEELDTSELEDDIDFPSIDKTAPFQRSDILAAAEKLKPTPAAGRPVEDDLALARTELETDRGTQPTLESLTEDEDGPGDTVILPRSPLPSSIAPISLDTPPRSADATLRLPAQRTSLASFPDTSLPRPPMTNTGLVWAIAGGIAACAAIAITAAVALTGDDPPKASTTTTTSAPVAAAPANPTPRTADHGVRSAVIETPESASSKNPAAPGEPITTTTTSALTTAAPVAVNEPSVRGSAPEPSAKEPKPAKLPKEPKEATPPKEAKAKASNAKATASVAPPPATTQAPAPPPPPQAAPPPPPKPVATTGTVIVPESMMTITVDGEYRRVSGGRVVVSCGAHRITAGIKGTQTVNVPCGGSVSL